MRLPHSFANLPASLLSLRRSSDREERSPRVRGLILFSLLAMGLFALILAYQARNSYQQDLAAGQRDAARLTRILTDHAELTFLAADLSLRRASDKSYTNALFGGNVPRDPQGSLSLWIRETPQLAAMALADASGSVYAHAAKPDYRAWPAAAQGLRNTSLFTMLQEGADDDLHFALLPPQDTEIPSLIVLARKLSALDGGFAGAAVSAINPGYFVQFLTSIDRGEKTALMLLHASGQPLASGPQEALAEGLGAEVARMAAQIAPGQTAIATRSLGGSLKIIAVKRLSGAPIIAAVMLDESDFLAGWRSDRAKDIGFLAIFAIFGSVLSFFALTMAKQIRRVEESEQAAILANQAKSEFLASMSHELRTPLNAIIGFSEMMDSGYFGPLSPKQRERIHDINLCGNHLLQLITDILEFSKGEAGKLELQEEECSLPDIVHECTRIMGEKARGQGLKLSVTIAKGLPLLYADKRKVRQILLNLLSNAIKFTPRDGKITIVAEQDSAGRVVIRVADTGIGIAEEDIPKALSVFGQVNRNRSHEGTGLGLPLCRMFTELHGGELLLRSELGRGTTVLILFPAHRCIALRQEALLLENA